MTGRHSFDIQELRYKLQAQDKIRVLLQLAPRKLPIVASSIHSFDFQGRCPQVWLWGNT